MANLKKRKHSGICPDCNGNGYKQFHLEEGREHVIGYFSRAMTSSELNYTVSEKEALAIYSFVGKLHHYLAAGGPHTVITDHTALLSFLSLA